MTIHRTVLIQPALARRLLTRGQSLMPSTPARVGGAVLVCAIGLFAASGARVGANPTHPAAAPGGPPPAAAAPIVPAPTTDSPSWSAPPSSPTPTPTPSPTTPAKPKPSAPPTTTAPTISALAANGIPLIAMNAYKHAAALLSVNEPGCGIDWSLLAGIGRVESDHGRFAGAELHADGVSSPPIIGIPLDGTRSALIRDTDHGRLDGDTVYDRAVGPMQFIPSTWATWGADGNGDGKKDPFNINDAALAAADYLCAAGGNLRTVAGQTAAVLAYNHSDAYLAEVLALAHTYSTGATVVVTPVLPPTPPALPPVNPGPPPAAKPPVTPTPPHSSRPPTSKPPTSAPPTSGPPTSGSSAPPSGDPTSSCPPSDPSSDPTTAPPTTPSTSASDTSDTASDATTSAGTSAAAAATDAATTGRPTTGDSSSKTPGGDGDPTSPSDSTSPTDTPTSTPPTSPTC